MREPTSCRSITSASSPFEHLRRWLPRLAVQRVHRHAASGILRVAGLDHVVLHVRAIAVLRAEDGGQRDVRRHRDRADDVLKVRVDRRRVRHDADPLFFECSRTPAGARSRAAPSWSPLYLRSPPSWQFLDGHDDRGMESAWRRRPPATWDRHGRIPSRTESSSVSSTRNAVPMAQSPCDSCRMTFCD